MSDYPRPLGTRAKLLRAVGVTLALGLVLASAALALRAWHREQQRNAVFIGATHRLLVVPRALVPLEIDWQEGYGISSGGLRYRSGGDVADVTTGG